MERHCHDNQPQTNQAVSRLKSRKSQPKFLPTRSRSSTDVNRLASSYLRRVVGNKDRAPRNQEQECRNNQPLTNKAKSHPKSRNTWAKILLTQSRSNQRASPSAVTCKRIIGNKDQAPRSRKWQWQLLKPCKMLEIALMQRLRAIKCRHQIINNMSGCEDTGHQLLTTKKSGKAMLQPSIFDWCIISGHHSSHRSSLEMFMVLLKSIDWRLLNAAIRLSIPSLVAEMQGTKHWPSRSQERRCPNLQPLTNESYPAAILYVA